MALQMSVAFSANVTGVGAIAGPPYDCAQGSISGAMLSCMYATMQVPLDSMWSAVDSASRSGAIDDSSHMRSQRVWLYSGTQDSVVAPSVMAAGAKFYQKYTSSVTFVNTISSQHAWITADYGSQCAYLGSPYMNNCDLDAAGAILGYVTAQGSALNPPADDASSLGSTLAFDQNTYCEGGYCGSISMGSKAYVYVPNECTSGGCSLHVAFHGCQMTLSDIGTDFVDHAHLNEWAATNRIVVLYPQAEKALISPSNPEGCFDWWGYTNANYLYKSGSQMSSVWNMVTTLAESP